MTEREIFEGALDHPEPAQRRAYLDRACGGNAALRARIEALLQSHESASQFLNVPVGEQLTPAACSTAHTVDSGQAPGRHAEDDDSPERVASSPDLSFLAPSSKPGLLGTLAHYDILQMLGQGTFGIVFRAYDEKLQRTVAIKVMNPQLAATSPPRKRFLREARSAAAINHENIVQIYSVEDQPLPYLVMEYIEGQTLKEKLDHTGPLEVREVLHLGRQIASGLAAAHAQGLIHRDIKPGNILLQGASLPTPGGHASSASRHRPGNILLQGASLSSPSGRGVGGEGTLRVKIADFGLARSRGRCQPDTQSGVISGTPLYMSPEQAQGQPLDHRSDLFSLGSVLYQMACGRPPFRAATTLAVLKRVVEEAPRPIQEVLPEVPDWLVALIAKLHAKKPEDRFQSAREVADLLARCQTQLQQHGRVELPPELLAYVPKSEPATKNESPLATGSSAPAVEPARRPLPARRYRWVAAAAVLLALVAGLGTTEATGVTNVRSTIIRLFSPDGTLIVEVDDPGVSVSIDGEDMVITGAGAREIRLKPGQYKVLASKDGKVVRQELVTVTTNGRQVVRVSKEGLAPATTPPAIDPEQAAAQTLSGLGLRFHVQLHHNRQVLYAVKLPKEPCDILGVTVPLERPLTPQEVQAKYLPAVLQLPRLNTIDSWGQPIPLTADDLARLAAAPAGRQLEWFNARLEPSPEILQVLARFPRLTHCSFSGRLFEDEMIRFCQHLPRGITSLGLYLDRPSQMDARGIEALTARPIRHLLLMYGGFDREFAKKVAAMPKLVEFYPIHWGYGVAMPLTDEVVAELAQSQSLQSLRLEGNQLTDAGLESLARLKTLRYLQVNHNQGKDGVKLTQAGIAKLAAALPKCKIVWDGGTIEPKAAAQPK
jgi:serine/threonine protein kinase